MNKLNLTRLVKFHKKNYTPSQLAQAINEEYQLSDSYQVTTNEVKQAIFGDVIPIEGDSACLSEIYATIIEYRSWNNY